MELKEVLAGARVLPVLVVDEVEHAVPLARALAAAGLTVLEVTLRTPAALPAVERMAAEVPEVVVGVGTVTLPGDFEAARRAGARFAVSPGLTPQLLRAARDCDLPYLPGVMTPSEAMTAGELGFGALKLFPARAAGGTDLLQALAGPLPDLVFCPTGGIGVQDLGSYLTLPNVVCIGGSWMVPRQALREGSWETIGRLAREARAAADAVEVGAAGRRYGHRGGPGDGQ